MKIKNTKIIISKLTIFTLVLLCAILEASRTTRHRLIGKQSLRQTDPRSGGRWLLREYASPLNNRHVFLNRTKRSNIVENHQRPKHNQHPSAVASQIPSHLMWIMSQRTPAPPAYQQGYNSMPYSRVQTPSFKRNLAQSHQQMHHNPKSFDANIPTPIRVQPHVMDQYNMYLTNPSTLNFNKQQPAYNTNTQNINSWQPQQQAAYPYGCHHTTFDGMNADSNQQYTGATPVSQSGAYVNPLPSMPNHQYNVQSDYVMPQARFGDTTPIMKRPVSVSALNPNSPLLESFNQNSLLSPSFNATLVVDSAMVNMLKPLYLSQSQAAMTDTASPDVMTTEEATQQTINTSPYSVVDGSRDQYSNALAAQNFPMEQASLYHATKEASNVGLGAELIIDSHYEQPAITSPVSEYFSIPDDIRITESIDPLIGGYSLTPEWLTDVVSESAINDVSEESATSDCSSQLFATEEHKSVASSDLPASGTWELSSAESAYTSEVTPTFETESGLQSSKVVYPDLSYASLPDIASSGMISELEVLMTDKQEAWSDSAESSASLESVITDNISITETQGCTTELHEASTFVTEASDSTIESADILSTENPNDIIDDIVSISTVADPSPSVGTRISLIENLSTETEAQQPETSSKTGTLTSTESAMNTPDEASFSEGMDSANPEVMTDVDNVIVMQESTTADATTGSRPSVPAVAQEISFEMESVNNTGNEEDEEDDDGNPMTYVSAGEFEIPAPIDHDKGGKPQKQVISIKINQDLTPLVDVISKLLNSSIEATAAQKERTSMLANNIQEPPVGYPAIFAPEEFGVHVSDIDKFLQIEKMLSENKGQLAVVGGIEVSTMSPSFFEQPSEPLVTTTTTTEMNTTPFEPASVPETTESFLPSQESFAADVEADVFDPCMHNMYYKAIRESNCEEYMSCNGLSRHRCPAGLKFNNKIQVCDWPCNVVC